MFEAEKEQLEKSGVKFSIIGNCLLINDDCLKIMPMLGKVDVICTDPPYKLISGGNTTGEMGGCFAKENYDNSGSIVKCNIDWSDFMPLVYKVLRDPGHAYFMANNRHIANCENAALAAGFHLHNWLVWDKITATPNRWYMKNLEFIGFFSRGKAFYINDCGQKQLIRCLQVDESGEFADDGNPHPTEKPTSLMQCYIENSTQRGELVFDPFMGSGSTGAACVKLGRRFIGIEISEKYFNIAVKRITDAHRQGDFFIEMPNPKKGQDQAEMSLLQEDVR